MRSSSSSTRNGAEHEDATDTGSHCDEKPGGRVVKVRSQQAPFRLHTIGAIPLRRAFGSVGDASRRRSAGALPRHEKDPQLVLAASASRAPHAASRLHAMFGLTVRADNPARVLMGSAVVRTHSIDEDDYEPDGWFGCRDGDEKAVEPVTDQQFISTFESAFRLKRGNETGLSIVVPSVDERVNALDIKRGIVRSFFWPILLGELVVDLEAPGETLRIDAETLPTHRLLLQASEAAVIEFASWASTAIPAERITLSEAARPSWKDFTEQLLPESKLNEIRSRLETQQRVEIRVPVRVRSKNQGREECMSFFTVYVASCRDAGHRPIFLRDGIVITDVRCPQMSGNRSLVVVDDPPLAGLLGDSEGVNHTQWQKDSPKFHNQYVRGPETIKFVTRSVYEILQRLHAAETKGDPTLLLHIFYLPTDDGPTEPAKKPEKDKKEPVIQLPPPLSLPPPQLNSSTACWPTPSVPPARASVTNTP